MRRASAIIKKLRKGRIAVSKKQLPSSDGRGRTGRRASRISLACRLVWCGLWGLLAASSAWSAAVPGPAADACSLATKAEVEAVIGQPVTRISPLEKPNYVLGGTTKYCIYSASGVAVVISLTLTTPGQLNKDSIQQLLDKAKGAHPDATQAKENGIGDQAYFSSNPNGAGYLVIKGNRVLEVAVGGPGAGMLHESLKKLVKAVVSRV
jgi:hypothetical protein